MTFRDFSPAWLGRYLADAGAAAMASLGGYEIEGTGIGLVEQIEGDLFAVMGLPLLPLLAALRQESVIET